MAETLIDVVARLGSFPERDRYEVGPTIFAKRPLERASDAIVLAEDVVDGVAPSAPEFAYVLEVSVAGEVLDVWSRWRGGATPSRTEAVDAIIFYAANDAYLEPD